MADLKAMIGDEGEGFVPPFQKKYFSADVMAKYEPLLDAMAKVEEAPEDEAAFSEFEGCWQSYMDFSWCSQWDGKKYDVVFYGMSGYSGYLVMEYLKRKFQKSKKDDFTFAFAGRSASKVEEMRSREFAGTEWEDTTILTASFDDVVSLVDLVKSAGVIVNCAGPYMLTEGEVLVDACIWCKTDYVDLSQELPWSQRILQLHKYAAEAGSMVVPGAAGNAYADLGVFTLAEKLKKDFGEATRSAVCYCQGGGRSAGLSGGMLKTRAALEKGEEGQATQRDAFSLGGFIPWVDRAGFKEADIQAGTGAVTLRVREEDRDSTMSTVSEDKKNGVWRAPYVNAFYDSRVVRRSNMLHADLGGAPYGTSFNFQEYYMLPAEGVGAAKALADEDGAVPAYGALGAPHNEAMEELEASGKFFPLGEGPALEDMSAWNGFHLAAESSSGNSAKCSFVGADGYFESARVAVEAALAVRLDRDQLPYKGGVLTTSAAGGARLVDRVVESGVKLRVGEWASGSDLSAPSTR